MIDNELTSQSMKYDVDFFRGKQDFLTHIYNGNIWFVKLHIFKEKIAP